MALDSERDAAALERLSALVDGELEAPHAAQACGHWRDSGQARAAWHAYQVIGDVLRSEDLAVDPGRDAGFLAALRLRLRDEPVVLAPQPLVTATVPPAGARVANGALRGRRSWMAPTAVAAGFVAVVGAVVLLRGPATTLPAPAVASLAAPLSGAPAVALVGSNALVSEPATANEPALVASGQLIRDARLDRYLAAHKQFAGSSALGVPSGFMRNATAVEPKR